MVIVSTNQDQAKSHARGKANYKPNIWNYDHLLSLLTANYDEQKKNEEEVIEMLKEEVGGIIGASNDPIYKLELIDQINKLALSYYFEEQINKSIKEIACKESIISPTNDLYSTAFYFRVLRQHGYGVSQVIGGDVSETINAAATAIASAESRGPHDSVQCKHAYHLLVQDVRGMRSVVSTLPEDFSYALGAENTRLLHQKEMDEICERGIMGQA
ncbi:hypothetical protein CASFOL_014175 [Castilleja foliolosa]|uniref:Terpene synthase N-terminal domain-containing protein n=2 Tax=Castilleja foliolosa TaxID=1961234 RepID=A0ABD3DR71_9LAMI